MRRLAAAKTELTVLSVGPRVIGFTIVEETLRK
jgi:hypothetical protein